MYCCMCKRETEVDQFVDEDLMFVANKIRWGVIPCKVTLRVDTRCTSCGEIQKSEESSFWRWHTLEMFNALTDGRV